LFYLDAMSGACPSLSVHQNRSEVAFVLTGSIPALRKQAKNGKATMWKQKC